MSVAQTQKPTNRLGPGDAPSVLHVVLSLDCGGLEQIVVQLCRHAAAGGRRVGVACLERPGALANQAADAGAEVICLDKRPGVDWRLRGRLRSTLAGWRPDVVHTHQIGALFYAGPAARRLGVPVIHSEHGKHYDGNRKLRWLARYAASFCQTYVGVAPDVTKHAIDQRIVRKTKTTSVNNGVAFDTVASGDGEAVREELGLPIDAPVVGTVGRLEAVKNYPLLIRAFAEARASTPDARLLFVGEGSQRVALEQEALREGIADAVCFAGYQSDCAPYHRAMDVFCLTSDSEGLPLSLLEAMAAGTPVAASRVGGIPEVIRHGQNGLLFERRNPAEAAAAIRSLLEDRQRAENFATRAREDAHQNYSSQAMAAAYDGLYRGTVENT